MPLSSQTKSTGTASPRCQAHNAVLTAPAATLSFALASPNEHTMTASFGTGSASPAPSRVRAQAPHRPPCGRWEAMVEVCGGIHIGFDAEDLVAPAGDRGRPRKPPSRGARRAPRRSRGPAARVRRRRPPNGSAGTPGRRGGAPPRRTALASWPVEPIVYVALIPGLQMARLEGRDGGIRSGRRRGRSNGARVRRPPDERGDPGPGAEPAETTTRRRDG
jgi:hypothetical protein